jgi:hypothetical protein
VLGTPRHQQVHGRAALEAASLSPNSVREDDLGELDDELSQLFVLFAQDIDFPVVQVRVTDRCPCLGRM